MTNGDTIDKIKKLLRMAEHPNSNEHEAAIALERAQKLLLENNLTRESVKLEDAPTAQAGIGKVDGTEPHGYAWKTMLIHVIAKANLCTVIQTKRYKQWHLFGARENVLGVLEMFRWVTPQLEEMADRGLRAYKASGGRENGRTWKTGFYFGATATIKARLQPAMDTFAATTGHELVLVNEALVKAAVLRVYPKMKTGHRRYIRSNDGYLAGREAGAAVRLKAQKPITSARALEKG